MANLRRQLLRRINERGDVADETEAEYLARARGYDPYGAAERASTAAIDDLMERYGETFESFRGEEVGAGRSRTGFAREDEDRLLRDRLATPIGRVLAQHSLQASGLELQNLQGIGGYGQRTREQELDLMTGELDRRQAEENMRRERRRRLLAALGMAGGAAVGTWLLPGVGTELGAQLGGTLGGSLT